MQLKRLSLPGKLAFPVRISDVHVKAGQRVSAQDPLYTLETADGKRGLMRSPFSGTVTEGPFEADTSLSAPAPVIGISLLEAPPPAANPEPTATQVKSAPAQPEAIKQATALRSLADDLAIILERSVNYGKEVNFQNYQVIVSQRLQEMGHPKAAAEKAIEQKSVLKKWKSLQTGGSTGRGSKKEKTPWGFGAGLIALLIIIIGGGMGGLAGRALNSATELPFELAYGIPGGVMLFLTVWMIIAWTIDRVGSLVGWVIGIGGCMLYAVGFMTMGPEEGALLKSFGPKIEAQTGLDPTPPLLALIDFADTLDIGSLGGASVSVPSPLAEELGLPGLRSFSNGKTPKPSAQEQAAFERFVLE